MDRVKGGTAYLFNHDIDKPIGRLINWRIEDGKLYADPIWSSSDFAKQVKNDIDAGVLPDTSIGYMVHDIELVESGDVDVYRVIDWEPYEGSTVTIPADYTVGKDRSFRSDTEEEKTEEIEEPEEVKAEPEEEEEETPQPGDDRANSNNKNERTVIMSDQTPVPVESKEIRALELSFGEKFPEAQPLFSKAYEGEISLSALKSELLKMKAVAGNSQPAITDLGMSRKETEKYSLSRAMNSLAEGRFNDGIEFEATKELAKRYKNMRGHDWNGRSILVPFEVQSRLMAHGKRVLDSTQSTAGASLVPSNFGEFFDFRHNPAVFQKIGMTVFNNLDGTLTLPLGTSAGSAYWIDGTTGTITASDPGLGSVLLDPHWVGARTSAYKNLLTKGGIDVEGWLINNMMKRLENKMDAAIWDDTADSNAPAAIVGASGVGSVTGGSFDYADLLEFLGDVDQNNSLGGSMAFVTTPTVGALLAARAKVASSSEGFVLNPVAGMDYRYEGAGYPVYTTANCASAHMFFGDWSTVAVGLWGALEITVDPYVNAASGQVNFYALTAFDFGLTYPGAVSVAASIS
jgi:HK97 family phage major capsid protein